jgi:hypothetical protein
VQTLVRDVSRLERRWMVWDQAKTKRSLGRLDGVEATDDSAEEDVTMVVDDDDEAGADGQQDIQSFAHLHMAGSPPG